MLKQRPGRLVLRGEREDEPGPRVAVTRIGGQHPGKPVRGALVVSGDKGFIGRQDAHVRSPPSSLRSGHAEGLARRYRAHAGQCDSLVSPGTSLVRQDGWLGCLLQGGTFALAHRARQGGDVPGIWAQVPDAPARPVIAGRQPDRAKYFGIYRIIPPGTHTVLHAIGKATAEVGQPRLLPQRAQRMPRVLPPQRELKRGESATGADALMGPAAPEVRDAKKRVHALKQSTQWPGILPPRGVKPWSGIAVTQGQQMQHSTELDVLELMDQGHREPDRVRRQRDQRAA